MKNFSFVSLLLLGVLLASCGGGETPAADNTDTAAVGSDTAAVTEADAYGYPELDCGGEALRVLNSSDTWNTYYYLDHEQTTGESLDDVIYARNRSIEERFNMVLQVNNEQDIDAAAKYLSTVIMSGDDLYDVSYIRADTLPSLLTGEMLYDLQTVDGFRFEEPWWDDAVVKGGQIGDDKALFFASNYFSLYGFEATVCTYFNEQMFTDRDLEFPYQLVRDGKWTLERMYEYVQAGVNLNGDSDFAWQEGANSIYGIATWSNGYHALLNGAGAYYANMDDSGSPIISVQDEHFINVLDNLTENLFANPGYILSGSNMTSGNHSTVFLTGRCMFTVAQVKSANMFRDMEDSFGMLPMPKYDEAQEDYSCYISSTQLLMSLPVTNSNPERTAIIMDALSYESYRDVLPVYYEIKLSQKGLRNDDSIEMLDIVRANRYTNFGEIFGWTNQLQSKLYSKMLQGSGNYSSDIASALKGIEASIEKTMEIVND